MNVEYSKNHAITYTELTPEARLSVVGGFNLVQNIMTEYFESFKGDNLRIMRNNNAIWVVTKTRLHFVKPAKWQDLLSGKSYTTKIKPIRIDLESTFRDENENLVFCSKQEICVIDLDSRKPRKISTVDYPSDMAVEDSVFHSSFFRLSEPFSEDDYVCKQKVFSSDIDFSNHTNNVAYVRFLMNTLPCEFLKEFLITDFEIHYINESRENQILKIYQKRKNNSIEFLILSGEDEIVRARALIEKID